MQESGICNIFIYMATILCIYWLLYGYYMATIYIYMATIYATTQYTLVGCQKQHAIANR